jgi:hypothetical protein
MEHQADIYGLERRFHLRVVQVSQIQGRPKHIIVFNSPHSYLVLLATIAPGTGNTLTVLVRYTPFGGTITDTVFTVTFGATDLVQNYYNASVRVNTGDRIHVQVSYTGGNANDAHDLAVQLDMF